MMQAMHMELHGNGGQLAPLLQLAEHELNILGRAYRL